MDDSRSQKEKSGSDLLVGSIYAAEHHVSAGEARVHAVLYVLHVEEHETGTHGLLHGTDTNRGAAILPAESVAKYAGHSSRVFATRRPACIDGEARAGSNTRVELRNIRAGIRALRKRTTRAG